MHVLAIELLCPLWLVSWRMIDSLVKTFEISRVSLYCNNVIDFLPSCCRDNQPVTGWAFSCAWEALAIIKKLYTKSTLTRGHSMPSLSGKAKVTILYRCCLTWIILVISIKYTCLCCICFRNLIFVSCINLCHECCNEFNFCLLLLFSSFGL